MKRKRRKLLLVEDEAIIALAQKKDLERYGYSVETVYSGEDAVDYVRRGADTDLVLMDINLGEGIDGPEAAEKILALRNIPVVFLSSHTDPQVVEKTEKITSYGYVVKKSGITVLDASIKMAFRLFKEKERVRKKEKYLRESEALFRGLYDTMTSGSAIYTVLNEGESGSDYIVKNFNKASLRIEGKKLDEVVGKSLKELRPNIDEYGLIQVMQNVWITGEPAYFPTKRYTDEKYANYYENFIFKLPTGEVVTVYNDVTEQNRLRESLAESERLLREIIDSMEKGLAVYEAVDGGRDFVFVDMNKHGESITEYSVDEVIGKGVSEMFPGAVSIGMIEKLRQTWETGQSTQIPVRKYEDERMTKWVENYIFRLPSGKVVAMFEERSI